MRRALGRGHAWCWSTDAVGAFEKDIRSGAAYRAVAAAVPAEIILRTDTI
ncbi:MAG: hypothetical protein R2717_09530 [Schumannella sp.]